MIVIIFSESIFLEMPCCFCNNQIISVTVKSSKYYKSISRKSKFITKKAETKLETKETKITISELKIRIKPLFVSSENVTFEVSWVKKYHFKLILFVILYIYSKA